MGFLSTLGRGLGVAGSVLGAPFTGGGSLAALPGILSAGGEALSNVGRTASEGAGGLLDQRYIDSLLQRDFNRNRLDRAGLDVNQRQFQDQHGLNRAALMERMGMDRAKMGIEAPMARTRQAAYGDALQNVQDVNIDFKPTSGDLPEFGYTGGIRPSMFGANARAAGGELSGQALDALRTGSDVPGMVDVPEASSLVDLPEMTPPPGSGALEKTLGGVGLGASILGGLGQALAARRQKRKPPPTMAKGSFMDEDFLSRDFPSNVG